MTRYDILLDLIDQYKPVSLVEVGVWNGANAIRMINRALRYNTKVTYEGYDLFEEATPEIDEKEFNVKGHNSLRAVDAYIKAETGITPKLVKGFTRDWLCDGTLADFVFLDGGHSVATIASDYRKVKDSKVVVLDDYYTPDESGGCPDITKFGCNFLFKRFKTGKTEDGQSEFNKQWGIEDIKYTILPAKDPVKGGGFTQLVVIP